MSWNIPSLVWFFLHLVINVLCHLLLFEVWFPLRFFPQPNHIPKYTYVSMMRNPFPHAYQRSKHFVDSRFSIHSKKRGTKGPPSLWWPVFEPSLYPFLHPWHSIAASRDNTTTTNRQLHFARLSSQQIPNSLFAAINGEILPTSFCDLQIFRGAIIKFSLSPNFKRPLSNTREWIRSQ